jgi:mannose-1-phosphate guanylyltransferase
LLDTLHAGVDEVVLPEAVVDEITALGPDDPAAVALRSASWLDIVATPVIPPAIRGRRLGPGESAVLAPALLSPGSEAVLDDRDARRCARSLGIRVIGTLGLIVFAKRIGSVPSVRPIVETLVESGMYLEDRLRREILELAGEAADDPTPSPSHQETRRSMLHAVVMAGGSGTRFWPKSRRNRPKQLLKLHGDATMLQQTVARIAPLVGPGRTWIITGADQAAATRAQLPELPAGNVVAEPCPRDTAPCVGLAAAIVAKHDPDGTMIVMPADHVIRPAELFQKTVRAALKVIDEDPTAFVTFGVVPTRPETGYGYIERGARLGDPEGIALHEVVQFREKPDRTTAERFLAEGRFSWNAGIFVWRARAILDALARHRPTLAAAIGRVAEALGTPAEAEAIAREYPGMEKVPIDKAVMEKAENVRVLEVVYDWSDVGDWRALNSLHAADAQGNTIQGPALAVDTRGSIIVADDGALIATLGVEDLVIVQSGGATLIARKDRLDQLKGLVEGLDMAGHSDLL